MGWEQLQKASDEMPQGPPTRDYGDNPIEGTPLDPNRRQFLLGQQLAGGNPTPTTTTPAAAGGGNDIGAANRLVRASTAPGAGPEAASGAHGDYSPAPAGMAAAPAPAAPAAPVVPAAPAAPQIGQMSPEDEVFRHIMSSTMDDTPSRERINKLQRQYDASQAPLTGRQKLIRGIAMVAPVVAGAAIGGPAGAGGAAEGVNTAETEMHGRQLEQQKILGSQIEAERGRQEKQYERGVQLPITYMNMRMLRDYRNGMLKNNADRVQNQKVQADAAAQKALATLNKQGLDKTGNPIPEDQLPPQAKASLDYMRSRKDLADAQQEFTAAKTKMLPEQMRLAQEKLSVALQNHDLALRKFSAQYYGKDTEGNALPGAPMDEEGDVYGFAASPWIRPTTISRSAGEQGQIISKTGKELQTWLGAHRDSVGDVEAVIKSAFLQTPLADPTLSEAATRLGSYAALQPRLHGFRGQNALDEFHKMIGGVPKNVDALIAGINGIEGTASVVSDVGKARYAKPGTGSNPPTGAASKLQKSNTNQPVEQWERGPDGKPRRKVAGGR